MECGVETAETLDGTCAKCFTTHVDLTQVVENIDLQLCAHCRARRVGAHWHEPEADTPDAWQRETAAHEALRVHEAIEASHVEWTETALDNKHFKLTATVVGHVMDLPIEATASTTVRQLQGVCDRCSRMQGGFYAAIIQFRATDRDITQAERERAHDLVTAELSRQLDNGNRAAFLSKHGVMHGGHDYYIGDIEAARSVGRILKDRMGAQVLESAKLVGKQNGDNVYRVTFLVRLPLFCPGDVARGDGIHYVMKIYQKDLQLLNLETFQRHRQPPKALQREGGPETRKEAVIVSRDAGLQVLDPDSLQTVTLALPPWRLDDVCYVIRHEDRLYAVPPDPTSLK